MLIKNSNQNLYRNRLIQLKDKFGRLVTFFENVNIDDLNKNKPEVLRYIFQINRLKKAGLVAQDLGSKFISELIINKIIAISTENINIIDEAVEVQNNSLIKAIKIVNISKTSIFVNQKYNNYGSFKTKINYFVATTFSKKISKVFGKSKKIVTKVISESVDELNKLDYGLSAIQTIFVIKGISDLFVDNYSHQLAYKINALESLKKLAQEANDEALIKACDSVIDDLKTYNEGNFITTKIQNFINNFRLENANNWYALATLAHNAEGIMVSGAFMFRMSTLMTRFSASAKSLLKKVVKPNIFLRKTLFGLSIFSNLYKGVQNYKNVQNYCISSFSLLNLINLYNEDLEQKHKNTNIMLRQLFVTFGFRNLVRLYNPDANDKGSYKEISAGSQMIWLDNLILPALNGAALAGPVGALGTVGSRNISALRRAYVSPCAISFNQNPLLKNPTRDLCSGPNDYAEWYTRYTIYGMFLRRKLLATFEWPIVYTPPITSYIIGPDNGIDTSLDKTPTHQRETFVVREGEVLNLYLSDHTDIDKTKWYVKPQESSYIDYGVNRPWQEIEKGKYSVDLSVKVREEWGKNFRIKVEMTNTMGKSISKEFNIKIIPYKAAPDVSINVEDPNLTDQTNKKYNFFGYGRKLNLSFMKQNLSDSNTDGTNSNNIVNVRWFGQSQTIANDKQNVDGFIDGYILDPDQLETAYITPSWNFFAQSSFVDVTTTIWLQVIYVIDDNQIVVWDSIDLYMSQDKNLQINSKDIKPSLEATLSDDDGQLYVNLDWENSESLESIAEQGLDTVVQMKVLLDTRSEYMTLKTNPYWNDTGEKSIAFSDEFLIARQSYDVYQKINVASIISQILVKNTAVETLKELYKSKISNAKELELLFRVGYASGGDAVFSDPAEVSLPNNLGDESAFEEAKKGNEGIEVMPTISESLVNQTALESSETSSDNGDTDVSKLKDIAVKFTVTAPEDFLKRDGESISVPDSGIDVVLSVRTDAGIVATKYFPQVKPGVEGANTFAIRAPVKNYATLLNREGLLGRYTLEFKIKYRWMPDMIKSNHERLCWFSQLDTSLVNDVQFPFMSVKISDPQSASYTSSSLSFYLQSGEAFEIIPVHQASFLTNLPDDATVLLSRLDEAGNPAQKIYVSAVRSNQERFVVALPETLEDGRYRLESFGKFGPDVTDPVVSDNSFFLVQGGQIGLEVDLQNGLVAHYPFTEGSDLDISGNENHASITGAVPVMDKAEIPKNAYYFDGVDDYATIDDHKSFSSNKRSVSAWIKLEENVGSTQARIINQQKTATLSWGLEIFGAGYDDTTEENTLVFHLGNGVTWQDVHASESLAAGQWYHVAGVYDGTHARIYINGRLSQEVRCLSQVVDNVNAPVVIGANNGKSKGFNGSVDDVRIYNRDLNPAEIAQLADIEIVSESPVYVQRFESDSDLLKVDSNGDQNLESTVAVHDSDNGNFKVSVNPVADAPWYAGAVTPLFDQVGYSQGFVVEFDIMPCSTSSSDDVDSLSGNPPNLGISGMSDAENLSSLLSPSSLVWRFDLYTSGGEQSLRFVPYGQGETQEISKPLPRYDTWYHVKIAYDNDSLSGSILVEDSQGTSIIQESGFAWQPDKAFKRLFVGGTGTGEDADIMGPFIRVDNIKVSTSSLVTPLIADKSVLFQRENLPDGTYLSGTVEKHWHFQNGSFDIQGLKAIVKRHDKGLIIDRSTIDIGDIDADEPFTVSLDVQADQTGLSTKKLVLGFVDKDGDGVNIINSPDNTFWMMVRTNRAPKFSHSQYGSASASLGTPFSMKLLVEDPEHDPLQYQVTSGQGTISSEGVYSATFDQAGVHEVWFNVSDGRLSVDKRLSVVVAGEAMGQLFSDVSPDMPMYGPIHFLARHGIVIGLPGEQAGERRFLPFQELNKGEALKMVIKAAASRDILEIAQEAHHYPNLIIRDENGVDSYEWVAPYLTTAQTYGAISDPEAINPREPVTRLWLAKLIDCILHLEVPDLFLQSDSYVLSDSGNFDSDIDYDVARRIAFYGYIGGLKKQFQPERVITRREAAFAVSGILCTPTIEDLVLDDSHTVEVNGESFPGVNANSMLAVSGVTGLQAPGYEVNDSNEIVFRKNAEDAVEATFRLAQAEKVAGEKRINLLADNPVQIKMPAIHNSTKEIHELWVFLRDVHSGIRNFTTIPLVVDAKDSDGDGIPNSLDAFPDDPDKQFDSDQDQIADKVDDDWDNDGIANSLEMANGLDPYKDDADEDADGDGISNAEEVEQNTNPLKDAAFFVTGLYSVVLPEYQTSKTWNWAANRKAEYRFVVNTQEQWSFSTESFSDTQTTSIATVDRQYFLHVQARAENGKLSDVRTVSVKRETGAWFCELFFESRDDAVSSVTFGMSSFAKDALDQNYDILAENAAATADQKAVFYADDRFYKQDIRHPDDKAEWVAKVKAKDNSDPVQLTWRFPENLVGDNKTVVLQEIDQTGAPVSGGIYADLREQTHTIVPPGKNRLLVLRYEGLEETHVEVRLYKGWNLIALPVVPEQSDVEMVFSRITTLADTENRFDNSSQRDHVQGQQRNTQRALLTNNIWQWNHVDQIYEKCNSIQPLKGIWVYANKDAVCSVRGSLANDAESIELDSSGWHLFGTPDVRMRSQLDQAAGQRAREKNVWFWDVTGKCYTAPSYIMPISGYWYYSDFDEQ